MIDPDWVYPTLGVGAALFGLAGSICFTIPFWRQLPFQTIRDRYRETGFHGPFGEAAQKDDETAKTQQIRAKANETQYIALGSVLLLVSFLLSSIKEILPLFGQAG